MGDVRGLSGFCPDTYLVMSGYYVRPSSVMPQCSAMSTLKASHTSLYRFGMEQMGLPSFAPGSELLCGEAVVCGCVLCNHTSQAHKADRFRTYIVNESRSVIPRDTVPLLLFVEHIGQEEEGIRLIFEIRPPILATSLGPWLPESNLCWLPNSQAL